MRWFGQVGPTLYVDHFLTEAEHHQSKGKEARIRKLIGYVG
jgi:hypothetical protein